MREKARRGLYTAKYKAEVLAKCETYDRAGKDALLRQEGLYTSLISLRRDQREAGALEALGRSVGTAPASQEE